MSFNDYGKTPNVYRPNEVPYPGATRDMLVGTPGGSQTTLIPARPWVRLADIGLFTITAVQPAFQTVATIQVPNVFAIYLLCHGQVLADGGGTRSVNVQVNIASSGSPTAGGVTAAPGLTKRSIWAWYLTPATALSSFAQSMLLSVLHVDDNTVNTLNSEGTLGTAAITVAGNEPFAGTVALQLQANKTNAAATGTLFRWQVFSVAPTP